MTSATVTRSLPRRRTLAPALLLPSNMYFWAVTPRRRAGEPRPADPRPAPSPGTGRRRRRPKCPDTRPRNRALRSRIHVGSDPRCSEVRGRDQLGLRFPRRKLEGLLQLVRLADHDDLHPARRLSRTTRTTGAFARSTRTATPATGTKDLHSTRRSPTTRSWTSRGSRTCACATRATLVPMPSDGTPGYQTRAADRRLGSRSGSFELPGQRRARTTPASITATSEPQSSSHAGSRTTASTYWTPLGQAPTLQAVRRRTGRRRRTSPTLDARSSPTASRCERGAGG